jgi:hypothetical protein
VLGLGVLALLVGILLIALGQIASGGVQLMLLGAAILVGVLLEARRYRGREGAGSWESTSERFVDPTSGRLMEVQYNAATGERRYVDIGQGPS